MSVRKKLLAKYCAFKIPGICVVKRRVWNLVHAGLPEITKSIDTQFSEFMEIDTFQMQAQIAYTFFQKINRNKTTAI